MGENGEDWADRKDHMSEGREVERETPISRRRDLKQNAKGIENFPSHLKSSRLAALIQTETPN